MRQVLALATALLMAAGGLLASVPAVAQPAKGEIVIGVQCDRTGATQIEGPNR